MRYDKAFLQQTLAARGVDVEKINLDHVEKITSTFEKAEKHLDDFTDLEDQIPMTIVDKEELYQ